MLTKGTARCACGPNLQAEQRGAELCEPVATDRKSERGNNFDMASDSPTGSTGRDLIRDFVRGTDDIDLSGMDANTGKSGDQAFTFIGTKAVSAEGQLRA